MKARLVATLRRLNTHGAFWIGLIVGTASLPIIGGRGVMEAWCAAHLDGFSGVATATIEGAYRVALWVFWPALVTAAFGRPQWFAQPRIPPKE